VRKIFFDEKLEAEFLQKGYVSMPFLSAEEITYILEELAKISSGIDFFPDGKEDSAPTFHATWLETDADYKRRTYNLVLEVFSSHIKDVLADYKILSGNFIIKPPGKGGFGPHQHFKQIEKIEDTTLTLWCPLVDVDETNGTIHVVEHSHRLVSNLLATDYQLFFKDFQDELIKRYSKPIRMKVGEVLFFDDNLIHWSPDNPSSNPRSVIQAICIPSESKSVLFYPVPDIPNLFEVFETNSEFFIKNKIVETFERPTDLSRLGFVEYKNQTITEEEFIELLEK